MKEVYFEFPLSTSTATIQIDDGPIKRVHLPPIEKAWRISTNKCKICKAPLITKVKEQQTRPRLTQHTTVEKMKEQQLLCPSCISVYGTFNTYIGRYYGKDDLKVYRVPRILEPFEFTETKTGKCEKHPWEVFYKLAWFEDLLKEMDRISPQLSGNDIRKMVIDIHGGFAAMNGIIADATIEDGKARVDAVFKQLKDHPTALRDPMLLDLFVRIWDIARYSANKQKAKMMRRLLNLAFPKPEQHRARTIPIPFDERILLAYELMRKLTQHLYTECKSCFNKEGYLSEKDFDSHTYVIFQEQCRDIRLHRLSRESIKKLFLSPVEDFLDPMISRQFHCRPIMLRRRLREIKKSLH